MPKRSRTASNQSESGVQTRRRRRQRTGTSPAPEPEASPAPEPGASPAPEPVPPPPVPRRTAPDPPPRDHQSMVVIPENEEVPQEPGPPGPMAWRGQNYPYTRQQRQLMVNVGQQGDIPLMNEVVQGPINIEEHTDREMAANTRQIAAARQEIEELERRNNQLLIDRRNRELRQMAMRPITPVIDAARRVSSSVEHTGRNLFAPAARRALSSAANVFAGIGEAAYQPALRQRISGLRDIRNLGPREVSENIRHANALEAHLEGRQQPRIRQGGGARRRTARRSARNTRRTARRSARSNAGRVARRTRRRSARSNAGRVARRTRRRS